jgi:hypothetical protein
MHKFVDNVIFMVGIYGLVTMCVCVCVGVGFVWSMSLGNVVVFTINPL